MEQNYEKILAKLVTENGLNREFKPPYVYQAEKILAVLQKPKPPRREVVEKPKSKEEYDREEEASLKRIVERYNLEGFMPPLLKQSEKIIAMAHIVELLEIRKMFPGYELSKNEEQRNLAKICSVHQLKGFKYPFNHHEVMVALEKKLLAKKRLSGPLTDERLYQVR
jgi:hypothetical protein